MNSCKLFKLIPGESKWILAAWRICVFYESNLAVKLIDRKLNNPAAIWLEIGTGNNKWLVCNFYREHSILRQNGSEKMERQLSRFDFFNGC